MTDDELEAAMWSAAAAALESAPRDTSTLRRSSRGESATALRIASVLDDLQREFSLSVSRARAGTSERLR
jgi:hypothetical protein